MTTRADFIDDFRLVTDSNTNKNFTSGVYAFSPPSTNVASMSYVVRQFDVPLSADTRSYQLVVNMSDLDNKYYPVDNYDRKEPVGIYSRGRAVVVSANSGTATVSVYYYFEAPSGSTTFPAFTLNVIRRDFVDEF